MIYLNQNQNYFSIYDKIDIEYFIIFVTSQCATVAGTGKILQNIHIFKGI